MQRTMWGKFQLNIPNAAVPRLITELLFHREKYFFFLLLSVPKKHMLLVYALSLDLWVRTALRWSSMAVSCSLKGLLTLGYANPGACIKVSFNSFTPSASLGSHFPGHSLF